MMRELFDTAASIVTTHNRLTILVMLFVTAGVVAGIPQLDASAQVGGDADVEMTTDVAAALEHIEAQYDVGADDAENDTETETTTSSVYVRADGEGGNVTNVLSRESLLGALEYQRAVLENDSVDEAIADDGNWNGDGDRDAAPAVVGPPNLVALQLADDPHADIDAQRESIESASDEELDAVVTELFTREETLAFLPASYEPGKASAESMQFRFEFVSETDQQGFATAPEGVQRALHDAAQEREDPDYFTQGEHARQPWIEQQNSDTIWLIIPPALLLVLGVLAFAYRDVVDVLIGFTGVVVSVLWMFGILGWLGVPAGLTLIVGPVLIIALSIDFGLHVFMRYREHRGPDDGIRESMRTGTASVAVAFALVTITAAIGFLSNLLNPFDFVRELGIGITLGVVSAFVIFVTLVPALKVSADGLLERFGVDRRKTALGKGRFLEPVLRSGVDIAHRAAPAVVVLALIVGAAGGLAYTDIDRQAFQQDVEVEEWKTELPGPMAWEAGETEYATNREYVQEQYQSDNEFVSVTRFLVEGDVTDPGTLESLAAGVEAADDSDAVYQQGESAAVVSPLSVMETVAETDEAFAASYEAADTTGDGVPDRNVEALYDELYGTAPAQAEQVIERTDDGEYPTLLMQVPVKQGLDMGGQGEAMHAIADAMEAEAGTDGLLTVTPVGVATVNNAELSVLADDILKTMLVALLGVLVTLAAVYRVHRGSAMLGALTVVPIVLVVGMVLGGMYLFAVPLTFLTALLMSITIGLGIDYNIHISDRFTQELERGADATTALYTAVTGTGGALLGSALTSSAAFATIILHPSAQLQSFGAIVVLALALSFLLSVFVLPSLLYLWANWTTDPMPATPDVAVSDD